MSAGSPTEEFGPYLVYEQLGVGGMAQVHRAVEMGVARPRPVALKRMLSHIASSEDMVKSFVREARLASYLKHPNVAQTFDLGRVGEIYFIVMELITGRNLREVLRHCGATTGPMPVSIALNILNQICDALDYAHNLCDEHGKPLGIIHRDVSPSNVIVADTGVVKLIDFGIAKASAAGMQTLGGTLKGKFAYMAPEYIAGRIDARADLFAIGVIAHELLTNRPLFAGRDDIDTLTRVRDMRIDPPSRRNPQVPPEIDDVVMTALARDPDRRWQHATALRSALTTLTQRLDLVASNAQVVDWLDWAFTHEAPRRGRSGDPPDRDTQTDGPPSIDDLIDDGGADSEPSISIEERTAQLVAIHRKPAPLDPREPTTTEARPIAIAAAQQAQVAATPTLAFVPAPVATIIDAGSGPARPRRTGAPRGTSNQMAIPRATSQIPRTPSPTAPPPVAEPTLPDPASSAVRRISASIATAHPAPSQSAVGFTPPSPAHPALTQAAAGLAMPSGRTRPISTILTSSAPAPVPVPAPAAASNGSGPLPAYPAPAPGSRPPGYAAPQPALPPLHTAPFSAPRPARVSAPPPLSYRDARSAIVPSPGGTAIAPARSGYVVAVVLVVLAAALAAITVLFVLPRLT
ncbi:MAG TPA: protein kinase [Kofleriaceae bacterium]|nr:protein kinase [Kofleriaceae bacterium]